MTPRFTDHELLIRAQAVKPWREKVAELEAEITKLREALEKIANGRPADCSYGCSAIARAALQNGKKPDQFPDAGKMVAEDDDELESGTLLTKAIEEVLAEDDAFPPQPEGDSGELVERLEAGAYVSTNFEDANTMKEAAAHIRELEAKLAEANAHRINLAAANKQNKQLKERLEAAEAQVAKLRGLLERVEKRWAYKIPIVEQELRAEMRAALASTQNAMEGAGE